METAKLLFVFSTLSELGQEITSAGNFKRTVRASLHMMLGTLSVVRGGIFSSRNGNLDYVLLASRGIRKGDPSILKVPKETARHFRNHPEVFTFKSRTGAVRALLEANPLLSTRLQAVLGVPLQVKGEPVGLICLGPKLEPAPFTAEEKKILSVLAHQIAIALHHQRLVEDLKEKVRENRKMLENLRYIYDDTIRAFAAAIDAKDPYTRGHSARVAQYTVAIGKELGLPDEELEGYYVAGLLHDVGKIIVDKEIINKKRSLTHKEFAEIMKHTTAGYQILSSIRFPWSDVPLIAKWHHEKLNGQGYPDGLKGEEIHLGAKIICLADAFDAMTSHRPYRRRLGFEKTLKEIKKNVGIQFEKEIVTAFFRVLKKEIEGKLEEQRIIPNLDKHFDPRVIHSLLELTIAELSS
jgi:putative nucleotidyltransferase with HDIG domain